MNTFCPLPWKHVSVRTNGDYRICCHANQGPTRGVLKKPNGAPFNARLDSIADAVNSPTLKEVRSFMLQGKKHAECQRCWVEEESGLRSRRQYETEYLADEIGLDEARAITGEDGTIGPNPSYFDVRFGNLCNLKCRMCSPTDSSSWYDDHVLLSSNTFFQDTHGRVDLIRGPGGGWRAAGDDYNWMSDFFWKELEKAIPRMKHLYFAGGEPLLIERHYLFLERCIELGHAKNITVEYNSNISRIPARAWAAWSEFKKIQIGASVDGVGAINDYIRFPAQWKTIEENLWRIDRAEGHIECGLTVTVSAYNILHLTDFMKWKLSQKYQRISPRNECHIPYFTPHPLHRPTFLSMQILPPAAKERVLQKFAEFQEWLGLHLTDLTFNQREAENVRMRTERILRGYAQHLGQRDTSHLIPKFLAYTKQLDAIRRENFETTFPELNEFIGQWLGSRNTADATI